MQPRLATLAAFMGHPHARHLLIACGFVTGLVLAVGTGLLVVQARQDSMAGAGRELTNLSFVLAEETDRAFQTLELVQLDLIEHMREQGIDTPEKFDREMGSQATQLDLRRRRLTGLTQAIVFGLTSSTGRLINLSSSWPTPAIDLSGRDYFQALAANPALGSFIGIPVQGRSTGHWSVMFARAVTGADGRLIGIVSAGLGLDLFDRLFGGIAVGNRAAFSLYRTDGALLERYPRPDGWPSRTYAKPAFFQAAAADHEVVTVSSVFDGKPRLLAWQTVAHYPLVVTASDTVASVLQVWRVRTAWAVSVAILAELVLAGIVLLGVRQLRAQERLMNATAATAQAESARALAESELELARHRVVIEHAAHTQSQRFDVALNSMVQGLMMVDGAGQLLILNQRFIEIFGLPTDTMWFAETYADLADRIVAMGLITPGDMTTMLAWRGARSPPAPEQPTPGI